MRFTSPANGGALRKIKGRGGRTGPRTPDAR